MTVTSGFFNAVDQDRIYNADHVNEIIDGVISEGVYNNYGDVFEVLPSSNMTINVGSGKAYFNTSWILNDSSLSFQLSDSLPTLDRIDIVCLTFNKNDSVRNNIVEVIEGSPSSNPIPPTLTQENNLYQYPLAQIRVNSGVTTITSSDITTLIGTASCPYSSYILGTQTDQQTINSIMMNLKNRNIIINGDMDINQRSDGQIDPDVDNYFSNFDGYGINPDRWRFVRNNLNEGSSYWTAHVHVDGWGIDSTDPIPNTGRRWFNISCTTLNGGLSNNTEVMISQRISTTKLQSIHKGSVDAQPLSLSFLVRSNVVGDKVVEIVDVTNNVSHSCIYNIPTADVETRIEVNIPSDTMNSISNEDVEGLRLNFWISAGSDFTSGSSLQENWNTIVNANRARGHIGITSSASYFMFTDVQLEVGNSHSEYERKSYSDQLIECQKYFQRSCVYLTGTVSINQQGLVLYPSVVFPTPMREKPVITINQLVAESFANSNLPNIVILDPDHHIDYHKQFRFTSGQGGMNLNNNESAVCGLLYEADAEL